MQVIYEDNHVIIVSKQSGEIVQGDKTGDRPLSETVKDYIKDKYQKPGAVFLGVVHRLDRPVSGLVVFARTSKALSRLNDMFRLGQVHKTYWAIVAPTPAVTDGEWHELEHWLVRNERQNKSYAYDHEVPRSKRAVLRYRVIGRSERYTLLEVRLLTGRHHQILVRIKLPDRNDGCDRLPGHQLKQINDGSASCRPACFRDLVSLQAVHPSCVCKEHQVVMS